MITYLEAQYRIKDHKDLTATVQVLEPSTLSTAGVEEKTYTGWKLKEIQVNGKKVDELPATVSDKSAIVYYYEVDAEQTKNLKATVDYVLGSTVQHKDHKRSDCNGTGTGAEYTEYSRSGREELYRLETEGNPGQWERKWMSFRLP